LPGADEEYAPDALEQWEACWRNAAVEAEPSLVDRHLGIEIDDAIEIAEKIDI
jgi:hypothetical protein